MTDDKEAKQALEDLKPTYPGSVVPRPLQAPMLGGKMADTWEKRVANSAAKSLKAQAEHDSPSVDTLEHDNAPSLDQVESASQVFRRDPISVFEDVSLQERMRAVNDIVGVLQHLPTDDEQRLALRVAAMILGLDHKPPGV